MNFKFKMTLIYALITIIIPAFNDIYALSKTNRNIFDPMVDQKKNLMKIKIIPIYYANVNDVYQFLRNKKYEFLSKFGVINIDKRLRQLWIKDDEQHIKSIIDTIKKIDIPDKQVLIKARIVNIDTNSLQSLGLNFLTQQSNQTSKGFMVDLPKTLERQMIFPIVKLKTGTIIDLQLNALEQTGHAQILAKPELTTLNHQVAFIQSGEEVPYEEKTQSGSTSITFKRAALRLSVTPEILPNNKILLKLSVEQDKISAINIAGKPAIHTQKIKTQVLVNNQQTIVLGGIFEEITNKNHYRIPFLFKIPLLGFLFRHRSHSFEHKELIIFVTPHILS